MKVNGIDGTNLQLGQVGITQTDDAVSKNIKKQISNVQKALQELSSNEEISTEEKMKKRQELQQEITDLNNQLKQHQIELRKEKQQKMNQKTPAENLSNKKPQKNKQDLELSQAGMKTIISADSGIKQAQVQGNVAKKMENKADVLKVEIMLDESRATGGKTAKTEAKRAELAEMKKISINATSEQMDTLEETNQEIKEAQKTEWNTKKAEENNKEEKEKEEEISPDFQAESDDTNSEKIATDTHLAWQYAPVDVRI